MRASGARRALLGLLAVLAVLAAPTAARADTVTDWNAIAAAALQSPAMPAPPGVPGAGQGAVSTVHLAMVHGAVYDAINAIAGGHKPFVRDLAAERWYSQDAAVATAAYLVLTNGDMAIPAARISTIDAAYAASLAAVPPGLAKVGGIATGAAAATAMLKSRRNDGRFGAFRFAEGTAPGEWRPTSGVTDPGAWLKDVRPLVVPHADLFRGRPPYRLGSAAYAADFKEVKALGRSVSPDRSPDQTFAANYWGAGNATATMASLLRSVADTQGGTLADHARMFARAYANAADALIVTWRDKARYSFWRPVTAIHEAANDGNAATEPEAGWTSLIGAPPYPDHPSGLSAFGCSVAETLQHFYGRDAATFSGTSPAATRTFTSFSQVCDDIVDARVWSGIHFRFADEEAAKIGRKVAHWGNRHGFK